MNLIIRQVMIVFLLFSAVAATEVIIGDTFAIDSQMQHRIEKGRQSVELLAANATPCWRAAKQSIIDNGCERLSYYVRTIAATQLTNCHLEQMGLKDYTCEKDNSPATCVKTISQSANGLSTYNNFFTHIENICYFAKSDAFKESTERAVNNLYQATVDSAHHLSQWRQQSATMQQTLLNKNKQVLEEATGIQSRLQMLSANSERRHTKLVKTTEAIHMEQSAMKETLYDIRENTDTIKTNTGLITARQGKIIQTQQDMHGSLHHLHEQQGELHARVLDSLDGQELLVNGQVKLLDNQQQIGKKLFVFANDMEKSISSSLSHQRQLLAGQEVAQQFLGTLEHKANNMELIVTDTTHSLAELRIEQKSAMDDTTRTIKKMSDESREAANNMNMMLGIIHGQIDRLVDLDLAILGELFSLHSILFYTAAFILGMILTSGERTSSSRFCVISLIMLNIAFERVSGKLWTPEEFLTLYMPVRKAMASGCMIAVLISLYTYTDIQVETHKMMLDLHCQLKTQRDENAQRQAQQEHLEYLERLPQLMFRQYGSQGESHRRFRSIVTPLKLKF